MKTVIANNTPELFSIPLDNEKYIVYSALKGIAFIANITLLNTITNHLNRQGSHSSPTRSKELNSLHDLNFFQPDQSPVDEYKDKGIQYDAVILFLTNKCNLSCTYCYVSSGEFPTQMMPWKVWPVRTDSSGRAGNQV